MSRWASSASASAHAGRSAATLKRYAIRGDIIGRKVDGGQWVFCLDSIDQFFAPPVSKKAFDIVRSLAK